MDRIASMTTFATVVASGSFAQAAQRLNMSPAMVTNHVRSLEDRLGARLLNRTTRKLSLTEAGKAYYDQCTLILAQLEAADAGVADLNAAPRGTLRVNASNVIAPALATLFGEFAAAYPEVTVELFATERMVDLVEEGIDVSIRYNQVPDSSLIVRGLGRFRLIACAAPAYLERRGMPRDPSDLARHNCLSYMHSGFTALTREWYLTGPEGQVTVPISSNFHTNSVETLRAAVLEGRGIGMSQTFAVEEAMRAGELLRVLPAYHLGEFPIFALYPHRQYLPAKLRSFIDFAARHFAQHPKWQLSASAETMPQPSVAGRAG